MKFLTPFQLLLLRNATVVAFLVVHVLNMGAQISPGKLSKGHSNLEGISNCTACHELGAKISEQKCLNCHKALQARISQNKGYHVSSEIKGKSCITCHSEHHGYNFEMIRFDKNKFNHTQTGYELKGAHGKLESCARCHTDNYIADNNIKQNKNTFLGLDTRCLACHDDYHQKTLSSDCAKCHNFDNFKPAVSFRHDKTEFPLSGAHIKVDCAKCHKSETRNGKKFQDFAIASFKNCSSCHKDPHKGEFGANCKSCHTETSFKTLKSPSNFNHSLTGYKLEGKHASIDCKKCHDNRNAPKENYHEFKLLGEIVCLTCHQDVHKSKFGTNCKDCHSQQSFSYTKSGANFDHALTGYTLSGKHTTVDCKKCHTGPKMTAVLKHDKCADCHKDQHNGEFLDNKNRDCADCHKVTGFNDGSFGIEQHEASAFPLKGGHLATPCNACHLKENKWTFKHLGSTCNDCHKNIHSGFISEKYIPANDCRSCHSNESWLAVAFDHSQTNFDLKGKHKSIECRACHYRNDNKEIKSQIFIGLNSECAKCHENIHGVQFEENGNTDCKKCHGFEKFDRSNFNHNNAAFKLDGAHTKVSCNKCHQEELVAGKKNIKYKTGKLLCADCHS
ncbi:MAG: cytochrome c3 family protein [Saprospiraceae bacterium]